MRKTSIKLYKSWEIKPSFLPNYLRLAVWITSKLFLSTLYWKQQLSSALGCFLHDLSQLKRHQNLSRRPRLLKQNTALSHFQASLPLEPNCFPLKQRCTNLQCGEKKRKKPGSSVVPSSSPWYRPSPPFPHPGLVFLLLLLLTQRSSASMWHHSAHHQANGKLFPAVSQGGMGEWLPYGANTYTHLYTAPLALPYFPLKWGEKKQENWHFIFLILSFICSWGAVFTHSRAHTHKSIILSSRCRQERQLVGSLLLLPSDWGNGNWILVLGHSPSSRHRFGLEPGQPVAWHSVAWEHPASLA